VTVDVYQRNSTDIQSVARVTLECTNSPFAEDYVIITFTQYVLGGHKPFLNGG